MKSVVAAQLKLLDAAAARRAICTALVQRVNAREEGKNKLVKPAAPRPEIKRKNPTAACAVESVCARVLGSRRIEVPISALLNARFPPPRAVPYNEPSRIPSIVLFFTRSDEEEKKNDKGIMKYGIRGV